MALPTHAQGIEFFHGTWKEALEEAKKQDKLVFVDAFAQWCGPCKKMAKNVFTQEEVGIYYNESFVNLKLDMETEDGRSYGTKYPVSAYPTLFFLNPDGEVVKKITGGKQAAALIDLGKKAVLSWDKSGGFAEKYEAGDRDFQLMVDYVGALNKVNKPSLKISNEYLRSNPAISKDQMGEFLMSAVTESDSELFSEMIQHKTEILNKFSEEDFEAKVNKAAMATVAKAVEFDFEDLVTEAINNYKSAKVGDSKRFELEANLHYNLLAANYPEWKELSDKYLKKYGKKDSELYKKQLSALKKEFTHEQDFQAYACDVCKEMVKRDDSVSSYSAYIELLMGCKKYAEAKKVTEEAIKKAKSRDEDISQFERVMKYLETM